jgi:predicted subunit of tRNA(5-methylaminomethyl-2-thiouridylate) methyltransferase
VSFEAKESRNIKPILVYLSSLERLSFNAQVGRHYAEVLANPECRTKPDSFINWMTDVATEAQCAENIEIDLLRDRKRKYDVVPLLSIGLVDSRLGQGTRRDTQ